MAILSNNELWQHEMRIPAIYFLNASYCEDFSLVAYCMPNSSDHLVCLNPIVCTLAFSQLSPSNQQQMDRTKFPLFIFSLF